MDDDEFQDLIYFRPVFSFYTLCKRQKTRFSDVFRGYGKGTLAWNGLNDKINKIESAQFIATEA